MTEKTLVELLKYSSPKEIYIITHYGVLIRVFSPFKVRALVKIKKIEKGNIVLVQEIKVTLELKTVYIIDKEPYYYYYFEILV
ncbi:MAG TPA: hypothetical protein VF677_16645 [Flavobacterium sp.]|jgi:hypothetical protein